MRIAVVSLRSWGGRRRGGARGVMMAGMPEKMVHRVSVRPEDPASTVISRAASAGEPGLGLVWPAATQGPVWDAGPAPNPSTKERRG
jgi:hypothetical protein